MKLKEILIQTKEKILKEENWCQKDLAKDSEGNAVVSSSPKAVSFCALGALLSIPEDVKNALEVFENSLPAPHSISAYNDTHTHKEVLEQLDKAIASCK